MKLAAYFERIGIAPPGSADLATLALVMEAHSRAIAFENCDVVLKRRISITPAEVEQKLVSGRRGGYCFEQNALLQMALEEMGYVVEPLLCRVRWNKPDDALGPNTAFTHLALKVQTADGDYLADVGFAGTNSIAPVNLGTAEPQSLPEGQFRVAGGRAGYTTLELLVKGDWRGLYTWRAEPAASVDLDSANWFSCTYPFARFTTSFFVCRVVGEERHHILNDKHVVRKGHGAGSEVVSSTIKDKAQLLGLLETVFGIQLLGDTDGIDRYLTSAS